MSYTMYEQNCKQWEMILKNSKLAIIQSKTNILQKEKKKSSNNYFGENIKLCMYDFKIG